VTAYELLVDWDDDGNYTDESSLLVNLRLRRGRSSTLYGQSGYTYVDTGIASALMDDIDRRYDPYNTASPIYPDVKPHRKVKIQASSGGMTYNLFTGFIRDIRPQAGRREAIIECEDGIDWLKAQRCVRSALKTDCLVSAALGELIENSGWPFSDDTGWIFPAEFPMAIGGSGIEDNGDTIPYWWADPSKTVWQALNELAQAFAGDVFVSSDGTFSYNARLYGGAPKLALDQSQMLRDIELQQPWDEMRNDIKVVAYPRQATAANSELWRLNDVTQILAGETITIYAEFQYNGESIPASSVTTPAATTDYTANTNEAGTGTNKTAQIGITMTTYASSAKLEITNNDAATVYLTLMKLRGTGLYAQSRTIATASDATSQADYGKLSIEMDTIWLQTFDDAQKHADYAKVIYTVDRRVAWIRIEERPEIQFSLDLFDVIQVEINALGIDGQYSITSIEHQWDADRNVCTTTLRIEPTATELVSGLFVFPVEWNVNNLLLW